LKLESGNTKPLKLLKENDLLQKLYKQTGIDFNDQIKNFVGLYLDRIDKQLVPTPLAVSIVNAY